MSDKIRGYAHNPALAWDEGRQWLAEQMGDVTTDRDENPYRGAEPAIYTVEDLAEIIWRSSRADEGTISGIGAQKVAASVLSYLSDKTVVPAVQAAEIKAEALDEAVEYMAGLLRGSMSPDSGYVKQGRDLLRLLTERANKIRSEG